MVCELVGRGVSSPQGYPPAFLAPVFQLRVVYDRPSALYMDSRDTGCPHCPYSVPSILAARNTATVARASQARSMPSVGNQAPGRGLRLGTVAEIDAAPELAESGRLGPIAVAVSKNERLTRHGSA